MTHIKMERLFPRTASGCIVLITRHLTSTLAQHAERVGDASLPRLGGRFLDRGHDPLLLALEQAVEKPPCVGITVEHVREGSGMVSLRGSVSRSMSTSTSSPAALTAFWRLAALTLSINSRPTDVTVLRSKYPLIVTRTGGRLLGPRATTTTTIVVDHREVWFQMCKQLRLHRVRLIT